MANRDPDNSLKKELVEYLHTHEYYYDEWQWDEAMDHHRNWREQWEQAQLDKLCHDVRRGKIPITQELIQSIADPQKRRQLVEAICLGRLHPTQQRRT